MVLPDASTETRGLVGKRLANALRLLREDAHLAVVRLASKASTGRRTIGSPPTGISAFRSVP